jgi:hypothetical protein
MWLSAFISALVNVPSSRSSSSSSSPATDFSFSFPFFVSSATPILG